MTKAIVPKNSYILLDTCVLQRIASAFLDKKSPSPWVLKFIDTVIKNKTTLLTCDLLMFEFLRGATSPKEFNIKLNFLEKLFEAYISGIETINIIDVTKIANIYENQRVGGNPSFIDLFLVSILKNLPDHHIILATFNYHDFPTLFLERQVMPIDEGQTIDNLCFYKFNRTKFNKIYLNFLKTKYTKERSKKKR